jgi:hypothetical protein
MNHQLETGNWELETVTRQLLDYCRKNDFAGYDPYDAINSELFKRLPFLNTWLPRLIATQALKRLPFNLRPLLMIPKTQNPKALALFLMAFLKLKKLGLLDDDSLIPLMVQRLEDLRSPVTPSPVNCEPLTVNRYWAWGYSFPWQGRSVLAPRGEPNLVCTVFVANALLDLYESNRGGGHAPATGNRQLVTGNDLLFFATSAAEYLLNELYWSEDDIAGFSYPLPSIKTRVHNANFLGAALFCRIYKHTGEEKFLEPALKAARYSASMQHEDGSWDYGEYEKQNWVDNFHTGYNLGALRTICRYLDTDEFEPHIRLGFKFYKEHFFLDDGTAKYFHNKTYPIDIHSVAHSIITLTDFRDIDQSNVAIAHRVLEWAMKNMWDKRGYFYYQVSPYYKNKISYMRWSQAWMFLALATQLTRNESTA